MRLSARTAVLTVSLLAGTAVLAACGEDARPLPAPTSAGQSSAAAAGGGEAPAVDQPLDSAAIDADPCASLPESALGGLQLEGPGRQRSAPNGQECSWRLAGDAGRINVLTRDKTLPLGLSSVYREKGDLALFEPKTIDGYPAARAEKAEGETEGRCQLYVATSDKGVFSVGTQISKGPNRAISCDFAEKVATSVLTTLKGAS